MKKLIVLAGFAVVGFGQTALADEYAMAYTAKELSSVEGVKDVHARIVKVAKQYCPTYSQIRNHKDVQSCVDGVVADLVDKVDHPRLTNYHVDDDGVRFAVAGDRGSDRS